MRFRISDEISNKTYTSNYPFSIIFKGVTLKDGNFFFSNNRLPISRREILTIAFLILFKAGRLSYRTHQHKKHRKTQQK